MEGDKISNTFRGNASANFDIWFLNHHACVKILAAGTTVFGRQHPLAISVCEALEWNDTDAGLVVAAVARAEAYAPSSLLVD